MLHQTWSDSSTKTPSRQARNTCYNKFMENLPYRKGANAIVIDKNNDFLLVQKLVYDDHQWDFPGGGIDENETLEEGILRELKEELGTSNFEIIEKSSHINRYEWPEPTQKVAFKKYGIWWRGQEKHQFIIKFTGKKSEIRMQEKEIKKIKWVPYKELKNHLVFENQWEKVKQLIQDSSLNLKKQ
jgi:8-oxo-dGTP pyrophosphatase MutT (NUDIX family)